MFYFFIKINLKGIKNVSISLTNPMLSEVWNSYLSSSDQTQQNGFRRTTSMCRERIREAMLHHRWEEASEYMVYYPQILEDRNLFTAQPSKEVDFIIPLVIYPFIWTYKPHNCTQLYTTAWMKYLVSLPGCKRGITSIKALNLIVLQLFSQSAGVQDVELMKTCLNTQL